MAQMKRNTGFVTLTSVGREETLVALVKQQRMLLPKRQMLQRDHA